MVVLERVLVQVCLQVLGRDAVIDPADPVLDQRPEAVHRAGVDVAQDVHFQTVVNATVPIVPPEPPVSIGTNQVGREPPGAARSSASAKISLDPKDHDL